MSKETIRSAPNSAQASEAEAISTGPTAGEMLRRARESAGVELSALSSALKVSEKRIEALEENRFDLLPNPVFYRSLAASICKQLQMDAAPVLDRLPKSTAPQFEGGMSGINQPFRTQGDVWQFTIPPVFTKPATWVVLALLTASLIILLLPENKVAGITQFLHKSPPPASTTTEDVASAAIPANDVASQPSMVSMAPPIVPLPADSEKAEKLPVPPVALAAASVAPAASRPASAVAVASATASTSLPPVSAPVNGLVRFKAKGSVWIQVVDANGKTQLSKALSAGEIAAASGATPLAVTVGRADSVDVEVRGAPFNLTPLAKENIAKFEVK